jgi:transposase, IS30 family
VGYRMDDDDRARIWQLHAAGHNTNEISKLCGRAYATVATLLKSAGGIRPATRVGPSSSLRLSMVEREEISRGLKARETFTAIAERIERSPSTVSREVARNGGRQRYRATSASSTAVERARRPKCRKLELDDELRAIVVDKLTLLWSPEQIAGWLRDTHPDDSSKWISHETIYVSLFTQLSGMTGLTRCLRTGRPRRRPWRRRRAERRGKNPNMTLIDQRPAEAADRASPGHWEGDLIMGRGHRRAIGTVVERSSRYLLLVDLIDGFPTERVNARLHERFGELPAEVLRTLTWDQGTEMSGHQQFTVMSGIPVYFCEPRSPWQRPTNENTNGLLRQYFPKGQDLAGITTAELRRVEHSLNHRPRRTLNWQTPAQRLAQLCALTP